MPPRANSTRADAFKATVIFRLVSGPGEAPAWKPRITIPTLASFQPFRAFAACFGLDIQAWLYCDRAQGPLETCRGRWRPAIQGLAFDQGVGLVPSVAQSAAAFVHLVLPIMMERSHWTRGKHEAQRLSVLTWAVWKGVFLSSPRLPLFALLELQSNCVNLRPPSHNHRRLRRAQT